MSKRKRKTEEDLEWESDDFDIDDSPGEEGVRGAGALPGSTQPSLTADQVASVRFHTTRPGYSFEQVEIFVEQVKETLSALEGALYEKDVELYEAREEQGDLQDRISTLAATIEVFRAKGDPVRSSDGSYMTESQAGQFSTAQIVEMQQTIEALNRDLALSEEERSSLRASIADLNAALAAAEAQRAEAEAAEDELRLYVDSVLGPWMEAAQAKQEAAQLISEQTADATTIPPQEPVAPPSQPVAQWAPEAAEAPALLPSEETPNVDAEPFMPPPPSTPSESHEDDDFVLGGNDWDDAPSIGDAAPPPLVDVPGAPEVLEDEEYEDDNEYASSSAEAAPPILPPLPPPPQRARAKLIDAPELRGN